MKIKQVCDNTGLSERTIRFYIEKGLIAPKKHVLNERTYFEFEYNDVVQIEQIAILRKTSFSIDAILTMKDEPENIGSIVEGHRIALTESAKKQGEALAAIQNAADNQYPDLSALCAVLTDRAGHLDLPQSDVCPNFAQFDEETPEEREKAYQSYLSREFRKEQTAQKLRPLKNVILVLGLAIVLFGAVAGVSYIPRHIQKEFSGIELELGENGSKHIQNTAVKINGWLHDGMFSTPVFKGLFVLSAYPFTQDNQVEIHFLKDEPDGAGLSYSAIKDGKPDINPLGVLYADSSFRNVVIHLFDIKQTDDANKAGSTGNRVIAAPASDMTKVSEVLNERNIYWMDFKGVIHYPR